MQNQKEKEEVVIIFHNHVDPVWARCFEDNAYNGQFLTRSYMDIFEWMLEEFIKLSGQGFCYSEGQVVFWEKYLERNPEKEEMIRKLVREGNLEFLLQGFLTCDTNYVPAEGIIRNYLLAQPFYKKYGEGKPVKQAFLWDAFGSGANLPQILKQFGADRVGGTKYRPCLEDYWVGIDGSSLPCIDRRLGSCNLNEKPILYVCARHPHCPVCGGYGCESCNGRGMLNKHPFRKEEVLEVLEQCASLQGKKKFVLIGGEEVIPDECIPEAVNELNEKYRDKAEFRFGLLQEFWEEYRQEYQAVGDDHTEPGKELNPVNQGGYLTRIENKQRIRRAVYLLLQGEAAYASELFKSGEKPHAPKDMQRAWKYLLMNMHHDAVSGAHIDFAQRELMDYLKEGEKIAASYYKGGKYGHIFERKSLLSKDGVHSKKLGQLEIKFDLQGIVSVTKGQEDLFGRFIHKLTAPRSGEEEVRIGELIIQDDIGDLYGTYLLGEYICLGKYHYCVMEEKNAIIWRGMRKTGDTSAPMLEWETRAEASNDGKRLDFTVRLNAEMSNKRVSVIIPVNDYSSDKAVYEIPFGFIERRYLTREEAEEEIRDYYVPSQYERTAILPLGDYPALHWIHHEISPETGVAVFNKGLPCNSYMPGCFILGLMRTPQLQGVTVMPHADEMWDITGVKSPGENIFEFSIYPHWEAVSNGELTKIGYRYNDAEIKVPFCIEGNAQVSAFKVAEDEKGFILRVFETEGCDSPIRIIYEGRRCTTVTKANEEVREEKIEGSEFSYVLHKHEILSLRIE